MLIPLEAFSTCDFHVGLEMDTESFKNLRNLLKCYLMTLFMGILIKQNGYSKCNREKLSKAESACIS